MADALNVAEGWALAGLELHRHPLSNHCQGSERSVSQRVSYLLQQEVRRANHSCGHLALDHQEIVRQLSLTRSLALFAPKASLLSRLGHSAWRRYFWAR